MSHSFSMDSTGNVPSQPRQIRFVSTDGLPQTKRRRVNAACRTCRKRKIRCSGEQPVCKTCSDCNHTCLGYDDPPTHIRSKSDTASQRPTLSSLSEENEVTGPNASRAVESHSPDSPKATIAKSPQFARLWEPKDASPRANKDPERALDGDSPASSRTSLSFGNRTHAPYFRYFGPTAIVPGYKQMVVQVRGSRRSNPSSTSDPLSPLRSPRCTDPGATSLAAVADTRDANIPFYDRDDILPVSDLVTHLCQLFFARLGCNFPFLQQERFLRDLKEKKIDTMLVDAVCALSARFSHHPLLGPPQAPQVDGSDPPPDFKKSDHGQPFARRAMSALVDSLSCPTMSVVQACLLLAYDEFGSNHDSGLWMYLGISIRMAQDLGMQKLQGIKYNYGQRGLTPHAVMTGQAGKLGDHQYDEPHVHYSPDMDFLLLNSQRARERERVDTFWSIFFLDRVISSGTGRPVTLRDEDIELCFPLQSESQLPNGWPAPFPPLIRIIHLYGRVTDLINGIQDVKHVTPDTLKRLAGMESYLTGIYQRLSPKLHFNAANFQAYVRAKEGTNFILLHFWFHTLIVLLHQPTLLNSFGGTIQHLYPNSRELSMSSAKTIADILSFSELVDGKTFIGNPFTSQPMYVAACAFLMESAYYSLPSHGSGSPQNQPSLSEQSSGSVMPGMGPSTDTGRKSAARNTLHASAARENYQRCYKALKALEKYWEGTKYILTVLDQKAKGIVDPLLYTAEEMENTADRPAIQPFAPPNWRRAKWPPDSTDSATGDVPSEEKWSPKVDPNQAIGWALAGAPNSTQPNLSLLYQMPSAPDDPVANKLAYPPEYSNNYATLPGDSNPRQNPYPNAVDSQGTDAPPGPSTAARSEKYSPLAAGDVTPSDANLLLGLNTSYARSRTPSAYNRQASSSQHGTQQSPYSYNVPPGTSDQQPGHGNMTHRTTNVQPSVGSHAGDVLIESQDIDMTTLQHQNNLPFTLNSEVLPWLEYLPQDVLDYFGDHQTYLMNPDDGSSRPPQ